MESSSWDERSNMNNHFRVRLRDFSKKMPVIHSASLTNTYYLLLFITTSPGLVGARERKMKEQVISHDWNCSQAGGFSGHINVHVAILILMLMLRFLFFTPSCTLKVMKHNWSCLQFKSTCMLYIYAPWEKQPFIERRMKGSNSCWLFSTSVAITYNIDIFIYKKQEESLDCCCWSFHWNTAAVGQMVVCGQTRAEMWA